MAHTHNHDHTHATKDCLEAIASGIFAIIDQLADINETLTKINENMPVPVGDSK